MASESDWISRRSQIPLRAKRTMENQGSTSNKSLTKIRRLNTSSNNNKPSTSKGGPNQVSYTPNVATSNRYDALSNFDENEVENNEITCNEKKPAPIVILDQEINEMYKYLQKLIPSKKFHLKLMKIGIRVDILDVLEQPKD